MTPTAKIFISHSFKDKNYVKAFNDIILRLGLGINLSDIFCSSIEGQGIKSGSYIPDTIKEVIRNSSLVLVFISNNYKESEICLNELGASWVYFDKEQVIPILLPDVNFSDLGILDINRIAIKINNKQNLFDLMEDIKSMINVEIKQNVISSKVDEFLEKLNEFNLPSNNVVSNEEVEIINDRKLCFEGFLYPFNRILRKASPTNDDDLIQIKNDSTIAQVLNDLNDLENLSNYWIRFSRGDIHVNKILQLVNGNWLFGEWEVKIGQFWIYRDSDLHYDFILFKSEQLLPYKIDSDVGGEQFEIGVLIDGTYITYQEYCNNFTLINGKTTELSYEIVEKRYRLDKSMWVFVASPYHKVGYNSDSIIKFCTLLDKGLKEVNYDDIIGFLKEINIHPVVSTYR